MTSINSSQTNVEQNNFTLQNITKVKPAPVSEFTSASKLAKYDTLSLSVTASQGAKTAAPEVKKESLFKRAIHSIEENAGDAIVTLGKVPVLNKIGYWLYGQATKPEDEADEKDEDKPMGNLGNLNPNLIRGSQPREDDFPKLKAMGVNTVINLRPEENWEKPMIEKNGMKEIYLPLPAIGKPTNQQALQFLSAVTDPANGKVFFHCLHGADRTGAMAAAYRIAVEGKSADEAIAEMPKYNFHAGFQDDKLDFIRDFGNYWKTLPQQDKNLVLHR